MDMTGSPYYQDQIKVLSAVLKTELKARPNILGVPQIGALGYSRMKWQV